MGPVEAAQIIKDLTLSSIQQVNELTARTFRTRGGRIGSGMGLLLEALWGYGINQALDELRLGIEIGWIATHEYNDFACVQRDIQWDAATKAGEVLRVEIKSMVASAEESKAHFDKTLDELGTHDLLVVLLWDWAPTDAFRYSPAIVDCFVGSAREVALLRDELHHARGGSFVRAGYCPDGCSPNVCTHVGEPLNAAGKRERLSGPANSKPAGVQYAANFGGLVRMLKTSGPEATRIFRSLRSRSNSAHEYISFIHRNLPAEEANQFSIDEWRQLLREQGLEIAGSRDKKTYRDAFAQSACYQDILRRRFAPYP